MRSICRFYSIHCCATFFQFPIHNVADMGLGKTVQIIGLLAAIQKKGGNDLDHKLLQQKRRRITEELEAMQKREEDARATAGPSYPSVEQGRDLRRCPQIWPYPYHCSCHHQGNFRVAVYEGQNRRDALTGFVTEEMRSLLLASLFLRRTAPTSLRPESL